jgi:hypothetical protein
MFAWLPPGCNTLPLRGPELACEVVPFAGA